jgi:uncharacterized membrane protein YjgN (DUF898 family)
MRKKITFVGSFGEYFAVSLALLLLSVLTLGILLPYWLFWSFKYFFANLRLDNKAIYFAGHFGEYFLISLGLLVLSTITLGLALPYWAYWSFKYFFTRLEIQD